MTPGSPATMDDGDDLWLGAGSIHTRLDLVLSAGGCRWGKTRDAVPGAAMRAAGLNVAEAGGPWSVAFNTLIPDMACAWAAEERRFRLFPLRGAAVFRSGSHFTELWRPGATIGPVRTAVEDGRRLKARIAFDGYRLVVPVHTLEAHDDGQSFTAYTDYDGFPELLRHLTVFGRLCDQLRAECRRRPDEGALILEGPPQDSVFLSYFKISPDGVWHFDETAGDWRSQPCNDVVLLVEAERHG